MAGAAVPLAGSGHQPPAGAAGLSHWPAALAGVAIAMDLGKVALALLLPPPLRAELGLNWV